MIKSIIDIGSLFNIFVKNLTFRYVRDVGNPYPSITLINVENSMAKFISIDISKFFSSSHLIVVKNRAVSRFLSSTLSMNFLSFGACLLSLEGSQLYLSISSSNINDNFLLGRSDAIAKLSTICVNSESAKVILNDSYFMGNTGDAGTVLSAIMLPSEFESPLEESKITINNCSFIANSAMQYGGAIILMGGSLDITNSIFINNFAHTKAGAIFISNFVRAQITNTLFSQNSITYFTTSAMFGGAIYIDVVQRSNFTDYPQVLIESNRFIDNSVEHDNKGTLGGGGAIFIEFHNEIASNSTLYSSLKRLMSQNFFEGNKADYGTEVSSYPYSSTFIAFNDTESYSCYNSPCKLDKQVRADIFHGFFLHIRFIDLYDQLLDIERELEIPSNFKMTLQITNQSQIYSDSNCSIGHCIINGNDASIRGFANQDINLTFNVTSATSNSFSFVLMTSIRPCRVGEINDTKQLMCIPCGKGSYSLSNSDKACQSCPQYANCPGDSQIILYEGYWRSNNITTNIYPCNDTKVCNQELYGDSICAPGYKGPFCLACDLENGYGASGGGCGKCPSLTQGLIIFCSIQLAIFFIEIGYVWYFRKINKSLIVDDKYSKKSVARVSRGGYLTIILDYMQILTILKGYPLLVSGFLTGLTHIFSPSQAILFSSDCVFLQLGMSLDNLYYSKLMMLVALPYFKWFLFLTFGFVKKFIYSSYRYRTFMMVATQCMIQIEQPSMLYTLSSYLVCKSSDPLATDQSQVAHYMKDAPYVTCYTDIYYSYRRSLIIPMLLFWSVCLPLCLLTILIWNRKGLKTKAFSMKFGHQYAIYRSKCYYWNLVQFSQKFVLICFAQFSFLPLKTLGLTLFLILILFVILIKTFKPYRSIDLYSTEILSSYLFILTIFLAVYGYQEDALNEVISYVIIILNVTFILYIIIKMLHLMGFRWITRCLNVLLSKCFNRRKNSNFFFDENYHQRAESMLHPDDTSFVKRESRSNSDRVEESSRFYQRSEMPTQDVTNFQQSLLSTSSQVISTAKIHGTLNSPTSYV